MAQETKYRALARKLKALADSGVGGEKINAEEALRKLCEKHGISFHEIEEEEKHDYFLTYRAGESPLLVQICFQVVGSKCKLSQWGAERERKFWIRGITPAQYAEILAKHQFYKRLWLEEIEVLRIAFNSKHNLFSQDREDDEDEEPKRIGEEPPKSQAQLEKERKERERIRRAAGMMDNLQDAPFAKQIEGPK